MTSPGSLNKLLLLCGVTKALQSVVFQKLRTCGWSAFKKNKCHQQAQEDLRCGLNVAVMLDPSDLQRQCQQWLQRAKQYNATSIALHSTEYPIPEMLEEFRQLSIIGTHEPGSISQLFKGENMHDLEVLYDGLGYTEKVGQRQTHRIYAPASQEAPNLWLSSLEAELALAGIQPRDYQRFPEGCQEWVDAEQRIRRAQTIAKSEAKRLQTQAKRASKKEEKRKHHEEQIAADHEKRKARWREREKEQEKLREKVTATRRSKRKPAKVLNISDREDGLGSPPRTRSRSAHRMRLRETREPREPYLPEPIILLDQQLGNTKPVLLFDLNGTLTSHTAQRKSTGQSLIRPGIHHLRRLQERFNLGIYSSATVKTVAAARELLEEAAGPGPPLFPEAAIILHRVHTISATVDQKLNSGKDWDTMKPLQRYFSRMHQTLLVDDDAFKACEGEERNMILIPRWEEESWDDCIEGLVQTLLSATDGLDESSDLRELTKVISFCIGKIDLEEPKASLSPQ